ncbi:MAG: membrane dipeptidase [Halioglobus sp.]|jgi:microsomal dipeptidase-like Zn-dependent dipeptidase
MQLMHKKWAIALAGITAIAMISLALAPGILETRMNIVLPHEPYQISPEARTLHDTLTVADLHSDSTLWRRNLLKRGNRGHVDVPRMREGNVALQMFTSVTRSPRGQNYEENSDQAFDNITLLALVQSWPIATWNSLTARALYQAQKLKSLETRAPSEFQMIYSAEDLSRLLQRRSSGEAVVGGILGTEGSHALDGNLDNIETLFAAGFRMMSLQHFFDNKLGGSLHGQSGDGLSSFGAQSIDKMLQLGVMIDVSHSSPAVVADVLKRSQKPLIVSHTGFHGHCKSSRNIPDELMIAIAENGGLIGVGYWNAAICDATPKGIVDAIRYGIDLVGVEHVALGSDFDGSVAAPLDTSELSSLTHQMLAQGFSEGEIRAVMGENIIRFLAKNLPPQ